jgi:S-adenosylmethionine synthetase
MLPLKPYLTSMQISQFFVGLFGVLPHHFIDGCQTSAGLAATAFSQIYVIPLILLFFAFYFASYSKGHSKASKGQ